MKRLILLAALAWPLAAQYSATCNNATPAICSVATLANEVRTKPQAAPTSTTTVTAQDAYLEAVTITNTTAGAVTFTLADKQGSPVAFLSAVSIPANSTTVISIPLFYWCPGGFTVAAGGSGLTYSTVFKQ